VLWRFSFFTAIVVFYLLQLFVCQHLAGNLLFKNTKRRKTIINRRFVRSYGMIYEVVSTTKQLNKIIMARTTEQKKNANATKRSSRAMRRRAMQKALGSIAADLQNPKVIGKGAYNLSKAYKGKNAAAKRSAILNKAVDIGGRTLDAVKQFNSGDYLGSLMSGMKILGKGEYQLRRNTIARDLTNSQVPYVHGAKESIRFRHREYLGDLVSPVTAATFATQTYYVNPGISYTFPFLSPIAQQFQEYRFHGLVFEYKSTSAVAINSTNIGMGVVAMCAQYRSDAPTFTNKLTMMNEMWSVDGRPSDCFMLPIECAPHETPIDCLYVRGSAVGATDNVKFYDLAKVTVAMTGIPVVEQVIGELWVSYDVELFKPQAASILDTYQSMTEFTIAGETSGSLFAGPVVLYDNIGFQTSTWAAPGGGWTPNGQLGLINCTQNFTLTTTIMNNAIVGTTVTVSADSIVFPVGIVGTYLVSIDFTGASSTTSFASGTDAYGNTFYGLGSQANQNNFVCIRGLNPTGGTNTSAVLNYYIRILNPSAQTVITFAMAPTTSGAGLVTIIQANPNIS